MQKSVTKQPNYVYGLDIGTRSIVGTVGYMEKNRFIVAAQRVKEHETRAMLDGQIHDIGAVGETIRQVTDELELELKQELKQVCIAAAGRVLRTVTTHVEIDLEGEKLITKEDIFTLDSYGVEQAYEQFQKENDLDMRFYCVGYTVMRYYMNNYPMGNLENHKAKVIAADLIATFLPDDVVDGLYKAVELAGLEVANLTLEPIAAMEVAIPQMYRMLNIALIDVGAGTSDISITKDGSIVAYGMLPIAGDCLTEEIARHCLVDFQTAETIKCGIETQDVVEYKDIMGLPQTISKEEVLQVIDANLTMMAEQAADKIKELNGDKPVSAVFVVGGGGKIDGYTKLVAQRLGIQEERCAIRGGEVMQKIDFLPNDIEKDSLLVTPVGICLNYYEQSNNFMFVTFNGKRIKLYDNNRLAIVDAALQAEFPNEDLFPKRGESLTFTFNGEKKVVRGERGESAVILLNGEPADIHAPIRANDVIEVTCSTAGDAATMELSKFPEYKGTIDIIVNGQKVPLPKYASVNGELRSSSYEIQENDDIEMLGYYTVKQVTEVMDVLLEKGADIWVNHVKADMNTKVYDNFTLEWSLDTKQEPVSAEGTEKVQNPDYANAIDSVDATEHAHAADNEDYVVKVQESADEINKDAEKSTGISPLEKARLSAQSIAESPASPEVEAELKAAQAYAAAERISAFATAYNQTGEQKVSRKSAKTGIQKLSEKQSETKQSETKQSEIKQPKTKEPERKEQQNPQPQGDAKLPETTVIVQVNGASVTLSGKADYIYVDVFDRIDFDLKNPKGKMVETLINGRRAQFTEPLKTGDVLDIFWKD